MNRKRFLSALPLVLFAVIRWSSASISELLSANNVENSEIEESNALIRWGTMNYKSTTGQIYKLSLSKDAGEFAISWQNIPTKTLYKAKMEFNNLLAVKTGAMIKGKSDQLDTMLTGIPLKNIDSVVYNQWKLTFMFDLENKNRKLTITIPKDHFEKVLTESTRNKVIFDSISIREMYNVTESALQASDKKAFTDLSPYMQNMIIVMR